MTEENLDEYLFMEAFKLAKDNKDLWWQVRALQELGWKTEIKDLVLENEEEIESSGNVLLAEQLAKAQGDYDKAIDLRKDFVRNLRTIGGGILQVPFSEKSNDHKSDSNSDENDVGDT